MNEEHYAFGKNWRSFIEGHLTDERIVEARDSLTAFTRLDNFEGKSFLDIGCGSGLFSYSARLLGAEPVVSFDVDADSVGCCRELRRREGDPEEWRVLEGSVLDDDFMDSLGQFDMVYSWGVLHHTGGMWRAIENAAKRVAPGGLLYIAIYNKADGIGLYSDGRAGSSSFWEKEKRLYNALPELGKRVIDAGAASAMVLAYLLAGRNPVAEIKSHKTLRGMSWMVDIRDWLGGWPYEYASVEEIFTFVHERFGFTLENVISTNTLRNNEFLFRRV
jgi:SAM-dependent methyltransferase